jgi:hypothetical protein
MANDYCDACLEEGKIVRMSQWVSEHIDKIYLGNDDLADLAGVDYDEEGALDEERDYGELESRAHRQLAMLFRDHIRDILDLAKIGDEIVAAPERDADIERGGVHFWIDPPAALTCIDEFAFWVDVSARYQPSAADRLGVAVNERQAAE